MVVPGSVDSGSARADAAPVDGEFLPGDGGLVPGDGAAVVADARNGPTRSSRGAADAWREAGAGPVARVDEGWL